MCSTRACVEAGEVHACSTPPSGPSLGHASFPSRSPLSSHARSIPQPAPDTGHDRPGAARPRRGGVGDGAGSGDEYRGVHQARAVLVRCALGCAKRDGCCYRRRGRWLSNPVPDNGGGGIGGAGAAITATTPVSPGRTLFVGVGAPGAGAPYRLAVLAEVAVVARAARAAVMVRSALAVVAAAARRS